MCVCVWFFGPVDVRETCFRSCVVECARPHLHRPKHAFAPRSHTNQTSQGLDPNLYTRIDTIAPTPHANFGRGQLFPFIVNPLTIIGAYAPPPNSTFHPFLPNTGTHTHTRLRPKTTTLPHFTTHVFLNSYAGFRFRSSPHSL